MTPYETVMCESYERQKESWPISTESCEKVKCRQSCDQLVIVHVINKSFKSYILWHQVWQRCGGVRVHQVCVAVWPAEKRRSKCLNWHSSCEFHHPRWHTGGYSHIAPTDSKELVAGISITWLVTCMKLQTTGHWHMDMSEGSNKISHVASWGLTLELGFWQCYCWRGVLTHW